MTTWYVATTGSDSNDGLSSGSAFLTIPHAASVAQQGDVVSVASGDYQGSFTITCSGVAGAPITIKSETKWGARIVVPSDNAAHQWGIIVGSSGSDGSVGAYVIIDGFDVDGSTFSTGTQWQGGIQITGNGSVVQNCKSHDITTADSNGGAGVLMEGWYGGHDMTVQDCIVANIGWSSPATKSTVHGIYLSTSGTVQNCRLNNCDITSWHGANHCRFINNTVVGDGTAASNAGILIGSGDISDSNSGGAHYDTGGNTGSVVFNNTLYKPAVYGIEEEQDTGTGGSIGTNYYENNLFFESGTADYLLLGANTAGGTIDGDPLFKDNTGTIDGDYSPSPGSPAVGAGLASLNGISAPTYDIDGAPRSGTLDIGAYQVTAPVPVISQIHDGLSAWVASTSYSSEDRVSNDGNAYECITAGTSAASGGPAGTGSNITDGTAHWKYLSAIDYADLQSWFDALPAALTDPVVAEVWNDGPISTTANTPVVTLSGKTTSAVNTITIRPAPGEGFRDKLKADSSIPLAFDATNGVAIDLPATGSGGTNYIGVFVDNVILDGIQYRDPNPTSGCSLVGGSGANMIIRNCIMDGTTQSGGAFMVGLSSGGHRVQNSLFIDRDPGLNGGTVNMQGTGVDVSNCTFVLPAATSGAACLDAGNNSTNNSNTASNNIFIGYDLPYVAVTGDAWSSDHNACTTADFAVGNAGTDNGGSLYGLTAADIFVAPSGNYRLKSGSPCVDAGADRSSFITDSTDMLGTTRPQGAAWDMGAIELPQTTSGGLTLSQAGQGLASSASVLVSGRVSASQPSQTIAAQGSALATASLILPQGGQFISAHAAAIVTAALAATQTDTISASGGVSVDLATLETAQDDQSIDAAGGPIVSAVLFRVQGDQSIDAQATRIDHTVAGLNLEQPDNAVSAKASVIVEGTLSGLHEEPGLLVGLGADYTSNFAGYIQSDQSLSGAADAQVTASLVSVQPDQGTGLAAVVPVTAALTQVQEAQSIAAQGDIGFHGSVVVTQQDQEIEAGATVAVSGTLARAQENQAGSLAADSVAAGRVSESQAGQTISAAADAVASASLARGQASQTIAAQGGPVSSGRLAQQQTDQTISATAEKGYVGALDEKQADQTIGAAAAVPVTAAFSRAQPGNSISAAATAVTIGGLAKAQADQAIEAEATAIAGLAIDKAQADQTFTAAAIVKVDGVLAVRQDDQDIEAFGARPVEGGLAVTQESQSLEADGGPVAIGGLSRAQSDQGIAAGASVIVAGHIAVVQQTQTIGATSYVAVVGELISRQYGNRFAAAGRSDVAGRLSVTQAPQYIQAKAEGSAPLKTGRNTVHIVPDIRRIVFPPPQP